MTLTSNPHRLNACALALAALGLAACGGGSGEPPPVTTQTADTKAPTVTITNNVTAETATGPVTFSFSFDKDVGTSFTADDITVTGGTASAFTRIGGSAATLLVTPTASASGLVVVSVAAGKVSDASGNTNAAVSSQKAFNTIVRTKLVTFQESKPPVLAGFGGSEDATIVTDPTDATNKVAKVVKSATAELYAGVTVSICPNNALVKLPFSSTQTSMSARVWSPDAGIPVRLKVENAADGSKSVETEATTTVGSGWQTLIFNFANAVTGTAALNTATTYDKASIFFNFGKTGAQVGSAKTYYFDDLAFEGSTFTVACPSAGGGAGVSTISFDEATPPTLTGFGGAENSSIAADPTLASNKVLKVVRSATAEVYAGTTVSTLANFAIPTIGFVAGTTTATARVWSPDAGIPVRVKVENASDPTKSVETETLTTQASAWETLTFDFSKQATGTAAINLATVYNKASVFFNFGKTGAQAGVKTYYLDDLSFPTAGSAGAGGAGGLPVAPGTVAFSTGFGTTTTVQGGAYGGYSGSSVDGFNCGAPASCGIGGSFAPAVTAANSGIYYYYQTPSAVTALYAGIYVQAPNLTTGLSSTADTPGVSINGKTTMKFQFGQNPEWFNSPTNNFGVILTLGKFYNVGSVSAPAACNIKLLAVVTPTAQAASNYSIPLSSFALIQTCNVSGLTPASALALAPLSQVDFQAVGSANPLPPVNGKLVGANMSVSTGSPAVFPTTLVVNGGISFD